MVVRLRLPGLRGVITFAAIQIPTMKTKLTRSLAILFSLGAALIMTNACRSTREGIRPEWPSRVFAPYMYIGSGDNFKLTDCDDACGLKHYTLAFIIAKQDGRGKDAKYSKEPSWDGNTLIGEN